MTEIPNAFGGFAPFPNTIMIPTMGLQSAVIGYRFGFGYEQGKRAVRKMSNEEFNNLDEAAEQAMFKRHDSSAIDYFKTEMVHWVELQNLIIEKSVEIEVMKANRTPSALREIFEGFTQGFTQQQKTDAGKFFAGMNDTLLKIMAFFTGHKPTQPVKSIPAGPTIQQPFSPSNPTPFTPLTTKTPTVPKTETFTRTEIVHFTNVKLTDQRIQAMQMNIKNKVDVFDSKFQLNIKMIQLTKFIEVLRVNNLFARYALWRKING